MSTRKPSCVSRVTNRFEGRAICSYDPGLGSRDDSLGTAGSSGGGGGGGDDDDDINRLLYRILIR